MKWLYVLQEDFSWPKIVSAPVDGLSLHVLNLLYRCSNWAVKWKAEIATGESSSRKRTCVQQKCGASVYLHDNTVGANRTSCTVPVRVRFCKTKGIFTTYPLYLSFTPRSSLLFLIKQGSWVMNGYQKKNVERQKNSNQAKQMPQVCKPKYISSKIRVK